MKSFITSCVIAIAVLFIFFNYSTINYQMPDYEKIADRITNKVAKQLKDEEQLFLIGTGGGMMHYIWFMSRILILLQ